jgi:hypothetical protein
MELEHIIDLARHPITHSGFRRRCKQALDSDGVLALTGFMTDPAVNALRDEGIAKLGEAWFSPKYHNVYVTQPDPDLPASHPVNRQVLSTKGCITDDQISDGSPLRQLYDALEFRSFLCHVLGLEQLHPYADPMSSINLHYAKCGQELGWHFDNSSFAITLMIQPAEAGGTFEYFTAVRDTDAKDMGFDTVNRILDGQLVPSELTMDAGALVLFRGRDAIHRVTPNQGDTVRMLAVLAYNIEPGISLSEESRMTFYGRLG